MKKSDPSNDKPFAELKLRFTDPYQSEYEVIRPIMLDGQTVSERSEEVGLPRTTVGDKAKRFVQQGMLGLLDGRQVINREVGYPDPIAAYILGLKLLYPPIHYREIVRIIQSKFGYKTDHKKVKRFLDANPIPVQLTLPLPLELEVQSFHEFDDPYEARWLVVRMFHEGWNKKSIASLLKLSRKHVAELIESFEKDGFEGLEDKRTRPEQHPHNQMTLPFLETIFRLQLEYPDVGRVRMHSTVAQQIEEKEPDKGVNKRIPSTTTVGRAMKYNRVLRGAPDPLKPHPRTTGEPAELPYQPEYLHHYWFIDIRYLIKLDKKWVYSICIIEGVSRAILAGCVSRHQDEVAILHLFHAALSQYGAPWGIVSDNGAVFMADAFVSVLETLSIQPCPIDKGKPWQNLIEAQFNIQRRLADAKFKQSETFAELQHHHAAFVHLFNTTRHWAHRDRTDNKLSPIAVLAGQLGRVTTAEQLQHTFRQLNLSRVINQHGYVTVNRFRFYAERGLPHQRVTVWVYQDRLHIEYQQTILAHYTYKLDRKTRKLTALSEPALYDTRFTSTQLPLFLLDEKQWLKIIRLADYTKRQKPTGKIEQLSLPFPITMFLIWLFNLP